MNFEFRAEILRALKKVTKGYKRLQIPEFRFCVWSIIYDENDKSIHLSKVLKKRQKCS